MEKDDEEIEIDFSKITNIFRKKKEEPEKKASSEIKEVEKEIEEDIKEEEIKVKELKREEIESEEKIEKLREEKEKLEDVNDIIGQEEEKIDFFEDEKEDIWKEEEKEEKILSKEKKKFENIKQEVKEMEEADEEIDFKKIKGSFKNLFKFGKEEKKDIPEEESSINLKSTFDFFKKNKYAVPVLLIIIAIFFSVFFRMYPANLPMTDVWAENTVYNYYKGQISDNIDQKYPNLPDVNKNTLIENDFKEILKSQKDLIKQQIEATSQQFKSHFKYAGEDGKEYNYLSDIDTYLWYGEAKNYLKYGHFGTALVDGKEINFLRNGREGLEMPNIKFHTLFEVYLYKFISFFDRGIPLTSVIFVVSVIIIALSVIPAFLIGHKVGGNIGGFFAGMIVALNPAVLGRTSGGVADTDPWNIFFPLVIMWLFIEAFEAKDFKRQAIYASLSAFSVGLFSYAWMGWWYPFDFILIMMGIYFVYLLILKFFKKEDISKSITQLASLGGIFFVVSAIFVTLFQGFTTFLMFFKGPLGFTTIKEVGIFSLWPNVFTTVAEFNEVPLGTIMAQMGGKFLFLLAVIGILLTMVKKNTDGKRDVKYAIFLTIWFIGTAYGFTKGIRFAILMVPAFAVAFGAAVGIMYCYISKWVTKELKVNAIVTKSVAVILFCLLLLSPIKAADNIARNEMPLMNDAWYDSLIGIKDNSTDAIITSWWDYGHWFVSVAERRVTFDGADQGERIHWVGKSLLTSNETLAVGILRMLNCGQEKAPHVLEKYLDNDTVKAVELLNKIMVIDKEKASAELKKAGLSEEAVNEVLNVTHCDNLIEQFYIASEDMIKKAGVWAHFGGWDFERAFVYNTITNNYSNNREGGINFLKEKLNYSESKAEQMYDEASGFASNKDADAWISPWPSYTSNVDRCLKKGNSLQCNNGLEINLTNYNAVVNTQSGKMQLTSLVYFNGEDVVEKRFEGNVLPFSVALIPAGNEFETVWMQPELSMSMFTRLFFFQGEGLKQFRPFSYNRGIVGTEVYVYKVDWKQGKQNRVIGVQEKVEEEQKTEVKNENASTEITKEEPKKEETAEPKATTNTTSGEKEFEIEI